MLALTDQGLAHLAIAASRVSQPQRRDWLRDLAAKLDPPQRATADAQRQARRRAHHRNGKRYHGFWLDDRAIEGLILKFVLESKLTERDALDHRKIEAAIAALLEEEGHRWLP
jgi:hypothetical protein